MQCAIGAWLIGNVGISNITFAVSPPSPPMPAFPPFPPSPPLGPANPSVTVAVHSPCAPLPPSPPSPPLPPGPPSILMNKEPCGVIVSDTIKIRSTPVVPFVPFWPFSPSKPLSPRCTPLLPLLPLGGVGGTPSFGERSMTQPVPKVSVLQLQPRGSRFPVLFLGQSGGSSMVT